MLSETVIYLRGGDCVLITLLTWLVPDPCIPETGSVILIGGWGRQLVLDRVRGTDKEARTKVSLSENRP